MTTLSVKDEIDSVIQRLKDIIPGFRERRTQKIMISEIAKTFWNAEVPEEGKTPNGHNIVVVEAPTGTGKSQSYLLPSILVARRKKRKLIVSSATVKLQQQLCDSELPRLHQCIEGGITYMIAKGRSRYVCPLKLEKESGEASQMSLIDDSNGRESNNRDKKVIQLFNDWEKNRWDGERDSEQVDDELWLSVSTDSNGCMGSRCSKAKSCPFFAARAKLENVDVVVTNHDLLLSDLQLGGGVILPGPEESFYVIDEAHHLPEKTLGAFASRYSNKSIMRMLEKLSTEHAKSSQGSVSYAVHQAVDPLYDALDDFVTGLESVGSLKEKDNILRFQFGVLPDNITTLGSNIFSAAENLISKLSALVEQIEISLAENAESPVLEKELSEANVALDRILQVYRTWSMMLTVTEVNHAPIAKWIETSAYGNDIEYIACASPVSAANALKHSFWDKALGVALTSATLTAMNSFDYFLTQSGLSLVDNRTRTLALPSPFNYQEQGRLILPKMKCSPKDIIGHTAEVLSILPYIYPDNGGMLVLFTSRKQMTEVRDGLPERFKSVTMMQGDVPPNLMIGKHKEIITSGKPSVMFGLASMAEGVDLPGNLCWRVVVVKLPFDVPTDPIGQAFAEWLESIGRNPFIEVSLPSASRKLCQYAGRLIRTETDTGEIYCLDNRLSTSRYGNQLIEALPSYRLEKNVDLLAG